MTLSLRDASISSAELEEMLAGAEAAGDDDLAADIEDELDGRANPDPADPHFWPHDDTPALDPYGPWGAP